MAVEADRVVVLAYSVAALAYLVAVVVEVEVVVERAAVAAGRVAAEVSRAFSGRRFFPAHPLRWAGRCQNAFLEAFS